MAGAGHRAHQAHGLAQHLIVAAHPVLEGGVDGLSLLGGPARLLQQILDALAHHLAHGAGLTFGAHRQLGGAGVQFAHQGLQILQGLARGGRTRLELARGLGAGLFHQARGMFDEGPGFLQPSLEHLIGLLAGREGRF